MHFLALHALAILRVHTDISIRHDLRTPHRRATAPSVSSSTTITAASIATGAGRNPAKAAVLPSSEWRVAFDALDLDDDGALSFAETSNLISRVAPGLLGAARDETSTFRRYDSDNDSLLDFEEVDMMLSAALELPVDSVLMRRERYTSQSLWLTSLTNLRRSSVLQAILQPLAGISLFAFLVALAAHSVAFQRRLGVATSLARGGVKMHSLLGGALSLLLVFRTNTAYGRFWEARKIWESLTNRCRELARFAFLYQDTFTPHGVELTAKMLIAFPVQLRRHLIGVAPAEALLQKLRSSGNRPLHICRRLGMLVRSLPDSADFSSRERLKALDCVDKLASYVGACERLVQTPVPLNYARHTSRFLTLWCLTLPLSLVADMGFLVVPVTAFVTWCLFGIQEIGLFIEHCALDHGGVFMDTSIEQIEADVLEAVQPDEDGWEPPTFARAVA